MEFALRYLTQDDPSQSERHRLDTVGRQNPSGLSPYGDTSVGSYSGLDAALSALAFIAFGVWLFNLVLPKIQNAGLLGGLGPDTRFGRGIAGEGVAHLDDPRRTSRLLESIEDDVGL